MIRAPTRHIKMVNMTRMRCVLVLLAAAATGSLATARPGSFFRPTRPQTLQAREGTPRQRENDGRMHAVLRCRGGADGSLASAPAGRGGGAACLRKQRTERGGLAAATSSKTAWGARHGQKNTPKTPTELQIVSPRGACASCCHRRLLCAVSSCEGLGGNPTAADRALYFPVCHEWAWRLLLAALWALDTLPSVGQLVRAPLDENASICNGWSIGRVMMCHSRNSPPTLLHLEVCSRMPFLARAI